jgi:hypothetical protein
VSVELRLATPRNPLWRVWNEEYADYTRSIGVACPLLVASVSWDQERKLRRVRAESGVFGEHGKAQP